MKTNLMVRLDNRKIGEPTSSAFYMQNVNFWVIFAIAVQLIFKKNDKFSNSNILRFKIIKETNQ